MVNVFLRIIYLQLIILIFQLTSVAADELRPNFLVVITDDQNIGTVNDKWMPYTKREIFDRGINFQQAFISNPQCCPSRATILTGKYSKNNGQLSNEPKHNLKQDTCAYYLRQHGYQTGFVGKYLNSDSGKYQDFEKRQFVYWYASKKNNTYYTHAASGEDQHQEHSTTWITDKSINFLNQINEQPFLLYVSYHAPHYLSKVDQNYQDIYKTIDANELDSSLPNFLRADPLKPGWIKNAFKAKPNKFMRHEKKSFHKLQVVDIQLARIIKLLAEQNKLDNTYIFFISDNGIFFGQHGLNGKSLPYEKVIKVPFAIRGPNIKPQISNKLTGNLDIAPTIYALADIQNAPSDGINILKEERDYYFLEGAYHTRRGKKQPPFKGVVSEQYRLFKTENDLSEFYDIKTDPYQLNNLYNQESQKPVIDQLEKVLSNWLSSNE